MKCVIPMMVVAGGLLVTTTADAQQPYGYPPPAFNGPAIGVPVDDLPSQFSHGGSCVRMCPADRTPCDPDYYKVADRRCNRNKAGYF